MHFGIRFIVSNLCCLVPSSGDIHQGCVASRHLFYRTRHQSSSYHLYLGNKNTNVTLAKCVQYPANSICAFAAIVQMRATSTKFMFGRTNMPMLHTSSVWLCTLYNTIQSCAGALLPVTATSID